jgi:branched-chain amino acid transport system ATP-binding protein
MLAIARALVVGPHVLALDEPSAGLSPKLVGVVMAKLREVRASGVAVLLVEQNARAALAVADRAAILVEGRIAHEGGGADLLDDPAMAALYLGRRG